MWHHDVTNARTCQFFRRLFDRLPVRISTSDLHHRILRKKIFHIRAYDFGVQFSFSWAAARSQQLRFFCGFGSWSLVFHCGLPHQISPLPPDATPSQTAVCSMMGESTRPSSFHNQTLSANKHVVQIYRSSLSAAVEAVQVSVEPRLSTALKDRSVVP